MDYKSLHADLLQKAAQASSQALKNAINSKVDPDELLRVTREAAAPFLEEEIEEITLMEQGWRDTFDP